MVGPAVRPGKDRLDPLRPSIGRPPILGLHSGAPGDMNNTNMKKTDRHQHQKSTPDPTAGFAFHDLGLHRLEALVFESNPGSMRMLEKCGFRR
jgi:hypothetical protein